jgi:hypothetical protein
VGEGEDGEEKAEFNKTIGRHKNPQNINNIFERRLFNT